MDISVVIVSYNVRQLLLACLRSVDVGLRAGGLSAEIIVVDNASTDGSPEAVATAFPQVRLIVNRRNSGFAAGNNVGIAASSGRYVLLLNPDTEVISDAISTMFSFLEANPRIGVVGPRLLNSDGSLQSSRRRFPTLATALIESTVLQRYVPAGLGVLRRYYCLDQDDDSEQDVDWLVGAALMVRREAIDAVGPMDERFFLYSEELDWCRRIVEGGWRVVYMPSASVTHHYGQSSGQDLPLRHIYFQDSKCHYFAKYYGRFVGALLRVYLLATYALQLAEETAKLALRHKPRLRRERLRLLATVLRSGLRP